MRPEEPEDEDMEKATAALVRAAKAARKLAQQTHTPLIIVKDGKLISEFPVQDQPDETKDAEKSA